MDIAQPRLRFIPRVVLFIIALTLCATLLPVNAAAATPSGLFTPHKAGLLLDGEGNLPDLSPVLATSVAASTKMVVATAPEVQLLPLSGAPVVLGIDIPMPWDILGGIKDKLDPDCEWFSTNTLKQCFQNRVGALSCLDNTVAIVTAFVGKDWGCISYVKRVLHEIAAWALSEVLRRFIAQLNEGLKDNVITMANYTLVDMLGKNRAGPFVFAPTISCSYAEGTNADGTKNSSASDCENKNWFLGQYEIMRTIGLFLIVPLLMLVVLQSLIRGSLFFLLRAFLIMLPIAVIGSVVITALAQVLMNVADDMSLYIASKTTSPSQFGEKFTAAVNTLDADSFGFFTVFWFIALIISCIIIFAELMLRQMGIYLTMVFVPIGFATMVYPPTMKWLKRAISLLLALIFMKVFIIAALSMGFAAMASTIENSGAKAEDVVINQVILAVIIFVFAGFGGAKILAFTPAAEAVTSRIADPAQVLGMGDFTAQQLQKYGGQVMNRVGAASQGSGVGEGVGAESSDAGSDTKDKDPDKDNAAGEETKAPDAEPPPTTTPLDKGIDAASNATDAAAGASGGGDAGGGDAGAGGATTPPSGGDGADGGDAGGGGNKPTDPSEGKGAEAKRGGDEGPRSSQRAGRGDGNEAGGDRSGSGGAAGRHHDPMVLDATLGEDGKFAVDLGNGGNRGSGGSAPSPPPNPSSSGGEPPESTT